MAWPKHWFDHLATSNHNVVKRGGCHLELAYDLKFIALITNYESKANLKSDVNCNYATSYVLRRMPKQKTRMEDLFFLFGPKIALVRTTLISQVHYVSALE